MQMGCQACDWKINYKCTCCLYGAGRNNFDAGNIHFEGHWKGWALKIETFLGPEMATSETGRSEFTMSRSPLPLPINHMRYEKCVR